MSSCFAYVMIDVLFEAIIFIFYFSIFIFYLDY